MLKALILATLFCLALTARIDLNNNGNLFRISLWYNNSVSWTLNGSPFQHLQALTSSCVTNGSLPVHTGSEWSCGPIDTLALLSPSLSNGQIVKMSSNGSYVGATDNDVLANLGCSTNQVAKWNGSTWICSSDNDGSSSFPTTCTAGQVLTYTGSAWACLAATSIANSDVLNALSCASGEVAKKSGSSWVCASDSNNVPTCSNGQTVKYNATASAWVCAADADTLSTIACNSTHPWPKYREGAWSCSDSYAIITAKKKNTEASSGTGKVALLNSVSVLNINSATTNGTNFKAYWGEENPVNPSSAAAIVPISSSLHSVTVRMINFYSNNFSNKTLTLTLTKNSNTTVATDSIVVVPGTFTSTTTTLVSGVSFTAGETISATITCSSPGLSHSSSKLAITFFFNV